MSNAMFETAIPKREGGRVNSHKFQQIWHCLSLYTKQMNALQCVTENDVCSLRIICTHARNNNQLQSLEQLDACGNTALLKACYLGRLEAAQALISFGANLTAINYFGQNALTLATYSSNYALVRELLCHRSYEDFNLSSITPALCVATLRQDSRLMAFFRDLDQDHVEDIHTVHGLTAAYINTMLKNESSSQIPYKRLL